MPSLFHRSKLPTTAVMFIKKDTTGPGKMLREVFRELVRRSWDSIGFETTILQLDYSLAFPTQKIRLFGR
jgi:hypothetical protein